MTKREYLDELERLLSKVSEAERKDILYDYEEHFEVGAANGKSEEQIIQDLGKPKMIAKELQAHHLIEQAKTNTSYGTVFRAVLATIGLGFFNLIFLLGPFFVVTGFILTSYLTSFTLIIAALALFLAEPLSGVIGLPYAGLNVGGSSEWLVKLFGFMTLSGLGVLVGIGTVYLSKGFFHITLKYLQSNVKVIQSS